MSITYGIVKETYILNNSSRTSYGIAAFSDCENGETATIIAAARDLSPKKKKVTELVVLCNEFKLSPVHLSDVVEDFLSEKLTY